MELDLQRKNLQTLDFTEMLAGPTPRNADDGGSNPTLDQDEVCAAREALHMGVTKIDAQFNSIRLVGSLHYFRALSEVDLSHNSMSVVRGDIWPRTLQKLDLSFNNLRHLSFVLQMQCPQLQWLNVAGNENLTSLGWGIYCEQRAREFYSNQQQHITIPEELYTEIGPLGDDRKIPVALRSLQVLQLSECENLDSLDGICLCRNLVELYADQCDLSSASSFFGLSSNRLVRLLLGENIDLDVVSTSPASINRRWQVRKNKSDTDDDEVNMNVAVVYFLPKLEVVDVSQNPLSTEEVELIKSTLEQQWMNTENEENNKKFQIHVAPHLDVKSHFLSSGCEEIYQEVRKQIKKQDELDDINDENERLEQQENQGNNNNNNNSSSIDMVAYVQQRMIERAAAQRNNNNISSISSASTGGCGGGGDKIEGTGRNEEATANDFIINNNNPVTLVDPSDASTIHSEIPLSEESIIMQLNTSRRRHHDDDEEEEDDESSPVANADEMMKELDKIRAMLVFDGNNHQRVDENENDDEDEDDEEEISHGAWTAPPAAKAVVVCSSSSDISEDEEDVDDQESKQQLQQQQDVVNDFDLEASTTVSSVTTGDADDEHLREHDQEELSPSLTAASNNVISIHAGPAGTPPLVLSAKKRQEMARLRQQEQNQKEEVQRLLSHQTETKTTSRNLFSPNKHNDNHHEENESEITAVQINSASSIVPTLETQQQQQLREQVMHFRARRMTLEEEKKQLLRDLAKSRKESAETARCIVDLKKMKAASTEEALVLSKQLDKTKREVAYAITSKKRREEKQNSDDSTTVTRNHLHQQDPTTTTPAPANSSFLQQQQQHQQGAAVSPSPALTNAKTTTNNKNSSLLVSHPHHFSPAESAAIHAVQAAAAKNLQKAQLESDKNFERREKDRRRNLRPDKVLGNLNTKAPGASSIFQSHEGKQKFEKILEPSPLRESIRREKMQQQKLQQQQQQVKRPSSSSSSPSVDQPRTTANSISRQSSVANNNINTTNSNAFSFVFTGKPQQQQTAKTTTNENAKNAVAPNSRVLSLRMPNRVAVEKSEPLSASGKKIHDDHASPSSSSSSSSTVFVFEP